MIDQSQGHKIARAIHELTDAIQREMGWAVGETLTFDGLPKDYQKFLERLVGELFDNEVIDGGNALPKLYGKTRYREFGIEGGGLQLHPHYYVSGSSSKSTDD